MIRIEIGDFIGGIMRKLFFSCLFSLPLICALDVFACEIIATPDKDRYQLGDTAIIKVEVKLTHRNCTDLESPKIKLKGLELIAKTAWKEKEVGKWLISYKLKVITKENEFFAYRDSCDRGGGKSTVILPVN